MGILIIIIGLLVGSFLNVCIYRIPRGQSVLLPPSHCPNCRTRLGPLELIPIVSYLMNRGKCNSCSQRISLQYPLVEFLNSLLWFLLYLKFDLTAIFVHYGILTSILIVISFIDLKELIIPDGLNGLALIFGAIFVLFCEGSHSLVQGGLGLLVGGGLFFFIAVVSQGAMGGGDIKLMAALGFSLGWQSILLVSFLSFILGAVVSVGLLVMRIKGRKDMIPFGPFIGAAAYLVFLLGEVITNAYWQWVL